MDNETASKHIRTSNTNITQTTVLRCTFCFLDINPGVDNENAAEYTAELRPTSCMLRLSALPPYVPDGTACCRKDSKWIPYARSA